MVTATLCLFKRLRAKVVGQIQPVRSDPHLGQVQRDHALHYRVAALDGDAERSLEVIPRLTVLTDASAAWAANGPTGPVGDRNAESEQDDMTKAPRRTLKERNRLGLIIWQAGAEVERID